MTNMNFFLRILLTHAAIIIYLTLLWNLIAMQALRRAVYLCTQYDTLALQDNPS